MSNPQRFDPRTGAYETPYSEQARSPPRQYIYVQERRDPVDGTAVFGLIMSILWIFGIGSLVAVICAVGSMRETRKKELNRSDGVAVAALVFGIVGLLPLLVYFLIAGDASPAPPSTGSYYY